MATIKKTKNKKTKTPVDKIEEANEPKKLSKAGEFKRKYPNGIGTIVDMRAVMR